MAKGIQLDGIEYQLVREYKDGFVLEDVINRYTEYFHGFDYIFGDYSYDKLRLKGFYHTKNENCQSLNDIENLNEYIKNFCAFECRYFLLEKKD